MEALLTVEQVADLLQVPVQTLYKWRAKGAGPTGLKVGKYLRYRPASVEKFLDELDPSV